MSLEAPAPPISMIPWSRISELIDRGRHDDAVEEDRQLVLEAPLLLGQVLAGQRAEPPAAVAVEGEADGRLEVRVLGQVGVRSGTSPVTSSRSVGTL